MDDDLTYSGGLPALQDRFERRRAPFDFSDEVLPAEDVDLTHLTRQIVPESATRPQPGQADTSWTRKRRHIAQEFVGKSELAFLNAQLISNLRKRSWPNHAPALFCRLWAEHSDHLFKALNRDPGTVFRRLAKMRETRAARREARQ
ncbi:hypothetical protein [Ruegeria atlantica]|uniref:Uncharacterized protein n=1 Tax=Ruegeria atlantica TaxID=81569 RepID=A0A0P1E1C7_9RHOB|nr:hypothetical protein [Ruegeria atlantica]CUH41761.1 hypothetical protein RUM4293_00642 [Ruegeria atlantica]